MPRVKFALLILPVFIHRRNSRRKNIRDCIYPVNERAGRLYYSPSPSAFFVAKFVRATREIIIYLVRDSPTFRNINYHQLSFNYFSTINRFVNRFRGENNRWGHAIRENCRKGSWTGVNRRDRCVFTPFKRDDRVERSRSASSDTDNRASISVRTRWDGVPRLRERTRCMHACVYASPRVMAACNRNVTRKLMQYKSEATRSRHTPEHLHPLPHSR